MPNIKFDIYQTPREGKQKKYHVRTTNKETVTSRDLMRESARHTTVSRADWIAAVEGLIDSLAEKLSEGWKNATAYIPAKGHYGRSHEHERW